MNDNLPPLPMKSLLYETRDRFDDPLHINGYTAEQMQAYARAALAAALAAAPQPQPIGIFREDDDIGHVELCPHQQAKLQDGDKLFAAAPQPLPVQQFELSEYDAGLLNDFGGGNVEWWQDYIRAELGRAYEHYHSQIPAQGEK